MSLLAKLGRKVAMLQTTRTSVQAPAVERLSGRAAVDRRRRWLDKHPLCKHCEDKGFITPGRELDHIIPLGDGGADDETNFQSLCIECHKIKTAKEAQKRGKDFIPV